MASSSKPKTGLLTLPVELLLEIADKLTHKEFLNLRMTCRRTSTLHFNKFCKNHFSFYSVEVYVVEIGRALQIFGGPRDVARYVMNLHISFWPEAADLLPQWVYTMVGKSNAVAAVVAHLPSLQHLELKYFDSTRSEPRLLTMSDLVSACKISNASLASLTLTGCTLESEDNFLFVDSASRLLGSTILAFHAAKVAGWLKTFAKIAELGNLQLQRLELSNLARRPEEKGPMVVQPMLEHADKSLFRGGKFISKTFRTASGMQQYQLSDTQSIMMGVEGVKAGLKFLVEQNKGREW